MGQEGLIVLLKNPIKGFAKTRIAATEGDDKALDIYLQLIDRTRDVCEGVRCHVEVLYSDFIPTDFDWQFEDYGLGLQTNGGLGEKMQQAFATLFDQGYDKAIIIGSDCPYLTPDIIHQAFDSLDANDVVFGPSVDGGYYLLGMSVLYPSLFQNITWSTDQVLTQSITQCKANSLSYTLLQTLEDVDDIGGWKRYVGSDEFT